MRPYIGIVHKDQESAYGISISRCPRVLFGRGQDGSSSVAMAEEAIAAWTEAMLKDKLVTSLRHASFRKSI